MRRRWEAFLPDLLPHLPGCPVPLVTHELRRAAQDFLQKTRAWVAWLPSVTIGPGTAEVVLLQGEDALSLVQVHEVRLDGRALMATTSAVLSESSNRWHEGQGAPRAFLMDSPGVLRLYPVSDEEGVLEVCASVKPGDRASDVPEDIAARYQEALVKGTLARLLVFPGRPWSNPELALMCESEFNRAVERANYAASTSFNTSRIAARHRWC